MLQGRLNKQPTKSDMAKKVEAWKALNSVLVRANSQFISALRTMLAEKETLHKKIEEKLEKGEGSEDDNAEYLFLGGYVTCLKDILLKQTESSKNI